jgi:ubiquinone/menaquinone biosynthesis C-methylase UbiE
MATPTAGYVLGYSVHEYERLMLQARILRPYTERFFRAAGLGPGMRVLDLGAGMGDVSLLAGDIVGPSGRVLGIDRDAAALDQASQRATHSGCSSWVTFATASLDEFRTAEQFDALVGRYVLLYQPDPASTIRSMLRYVKPGGIVVFHDFDFPDPTPSYPPCPLYDRACALIGEAFRASGAPTTFGRRLGNAYVHAGLPFPSIVSEAVVGGGPGSYVYAWIANTLRSVLPRLATLGMMLPPDFVVDETLGDRMEEEAVRCGSQIIGATQYGAWTRKP